MSFKVLATLFLIALACNSVRSAAPEVEEGVLVLTDENFEETVKANQYILVEFYAPWCGHCKSLAPEYAKAAQKLAGQEPAIALAKVDATVHKTYSEKHGVQGFPTLKFFMNGEVMEYGGGRTESEIVNWLRKKTQPSTSEVNSAEEVEKLMADNEVVVVYFGEKNADFELFDKVTKMYDDVVFAHTHSAELKSHYNAQTVALFKNFDEKRNDMDKALSVESLRSFIDVNMFPTVMEFTQKAAQRIFGENLSAMFVITNESQASKDARAALDSVAEQFKGKIVLSWSQIEDGIGKRLGDFVGIKDSDLPTVFIVKPADGDVKKYRIEGEITGESIVKFYDDFNAGTLKTKLKSEEIPETNDEPVKVVVGKSFEQLVLDETKDVLVEFYAPWCGHCKSLAPKYDELAKKLQVNPNIVIAKMDSTLNEVDQVSVQGFPTIKFFKAGSKSEPMDYNGDRDVAGFMKFLKENTSFDWVDVDGAASTEQAENKEDL